VCDREPEEAAPKVEVFVDEATANQENYPSWWNDSITSSNEKVTHVTVELQLRRARRWRVEMRAVHPDTTELPADGKSRYNPRADRCKIKAHPLRVTAARTLRVALGRCRTARAPMSHPLQRTIISAARRHRGGEEFILTLPTIRASA